ANSATTSFKSDHEFYGLYQDELPVIEKQWTDFTQGSLLPTGNPLNLGLSGTGFFALNSPTGVVYTRNGNVLISKLNQLESADGYTLRNVRDNGTPIVVDPSKSIAIDKSGVVSQGGQQIGQIEIADGPSGANVLSKLGSTYFASADPSKSLA